LKVKRNKGGLGKTVTIEKHLTRQEIKTLLKVIPDFKQKIKLLALINLYDGKSMIDTADYLMISYSNLKNFVKKWNSAGLSSLRDYKNQNNNSGFTEEIDKINKMERQSNL